MADREFERTDTPRPRKRKSLLGHVTAGLLSVVGVVVGLVALLLLLLQLPPVQERVTKLALGAIEAAGYEVEATVEHQIWPASFGLRNVRVSDEDGLIFEAERIWLDWSPSALFGGRVVVNALELQSPTLHRVPATGEDAPPEEETDGGFAGLPVAVVVKRIDISEAQILGDTVGEPIEFFMLGSAMLDGPRAEADLDASWRPLGEAFGYIPGEAHIDLEGNLRKRALTVDARVTEAPGGFLGRLIGAGAEHPVSAELKGSGPQEEWQLAAEAHVGGWGSGSLEGTIDFARFETIRLTGEASPGPLAPPEVAEAFGDAVTFRLTAERPDPQTFVLTTLDLTGAKTRAEGKGRVVFGETPKSLEALSRPVDIALDLSLQGNPIPNEMIRTLIDQGIEISTKAVYDPRVAVLEVEQLTAKTSFLALAAAAKIDLDETKVTGAATLEASDLSRLAPLIGMRIDGAGKVEVSDLAASAQGLGSADVAFSLGGLASETMDLAALTGRSVTGRATLTGGETEYRVSDLSVRTGNDTLSVGGSASYDLSSGGGKADLAFSGKKPELVLETLAPGLTEEVSLGGPFEGTATASMVGDRVEMNAKVALASLALRDRDLGRATLALDYGGTLSAGDGSLTWTAAKATDEPLLATSFAVDTTASTIKLDNLTLALPDMAARGSLSGTYAPLAMSGAVEANISDLGTLQTWLDALRVTQGLPVTLSGGTATARVTLTPKPEGQSFAATASIDNAVGVSGADALNLTSLALDASGQLGSTPKETRLTAKLTAGQTSLGANSLDGLTASADGTLTKLGLGAAIQGIEIAGIDAAPGSVSAEATYADTGKGQRVDIAKLTASLVDIDAALAKPTALTIDGGALALAPTVLTLTHDPDGEGKRKPVRGQITASAEQGPGALAFNAKIDKLPMAIPARLGDIAGASVPRSGIIAGTIDYSVGKGRNTATVALKADDLQIAAGGTARAVDLALDAGWKGKSLDAKMTITGVSQQPGVITASVPLVLPPGALVPTVPERAALRAAIDFDGRAEDLLALYPLEDHQLTGALVIDMQVTGTVETPVVAGSAALQNARYLNTETGTLLNDLSLKLSLARAGALAVDFSAKDGGSGRITGDGTVNIAPNQQFPFEAQLNVDRAYLVRRDDVTGEFSGNITAQGNTTGMSVTGRITANRMDISIPDDLPSGADPIDVTFENGAAPDYLDVPEQADASETQAMPISLDITLVFPGRTFVRGRGLDSEWSGELKVTGTAAEPVVAGALSISRGTFELAGRTFDIPKGDVTFDGGTNIDPRLDIQAETQLDEITGILTATGRASNPTIEVTSDPARPPDSVLAQVLFGKDVGDLTPFEALRLAQALRTLTGGGGGGFDPLTEVRQVLGVDTLKLDMGDTAAGGTESASVRVGKYVSDDLFVGVKQGLRAGESAVAVELDVTDSITVESEIGAQNDSSVGINWKWEY